MSTPPGAASSARTGTRKENAFTRKIGPLPMWAWVGIAGTLLILWAWYENRQNSQASSSSDTADSSEVPQFVNQTYTTVQPPAAPGSGSGSPSGGAGGPVTGQPIQAPPTTTTPTPVGAPPAGKVGAPPTDKKTAKPVAKKKTPKKTTGISGHGKPSPVQHVTGPTRTVKGTTGSPKGTTGGTTKTTAHHPVTHPARKTNPPVGTRKVA